MHLVPRQEMMTEPSAQKSFEFVVLVAKTIFDKGIAQLGACLKYDLPKLWPAILCNQTDSWFFYTTVYQVSIGYVPPNCFYEERELQKVQQSALWSFLAK